VRSPRDAELLDGDVARRARIGILRCGRGEHRRGAGIETVIPVGAADRSKVLPGRCPWKSLSVTWTAGYELSGYGDQEAAPSNTIWQPPLLVVTSSQSDPVPDTATSSMPPKPVHDIIPAAAAGRACHPSSKADPQQPAVAPAATGNTRRLRPGPGGPSPAAPPNPLR
jgi:hypothetical protein